MKNLLCNDKRVKVNEVESIKSPWGYHYSIYEESTPYDAKRYFVECGECGEDMDFVVKTEDKETGIEKCKERLESMFKETAE